MEDYLIREAIRELISISERLNKVDIKNNLDLKKMVEENKTPAKRGEYPERKMHQGDWKCSECGKEITELPFQPDNRPLYCRSCHQKRIQIR